MNTTNQNKITQPYMLLTGPNTHRKVHICSETKNHIITSFGTFKKDNMRWIVDDRYMIQALSVINK